MEKSSVRRRQLEPAIGVYPCRASEPLGKGGVLPSASSLSLRAWAQAP